MADYKDVLNKITADERYQENIKWGQPRPGHPEGTIAAHIEELEDNLEQLKDRLSEEEYYKLKVLVHTHDICKADARRTVFITHPESHASLGRAFLGEFSKDKDLQAMVQYHDVPYSMYQRWRRTKTVDVKRLEELINNIKDWDLFSAFLLIDGCTKGKARETLQHFFGQLEGRVETRFTAADIW